MVTASHNPKPYTGVKLMREGALAFSGDEGIQDVRAEIEAGMPDPPGGGSAEEIDIYSEFHDHMRKIVEPRADRPARVLADGGNGMAGPMVGPLLEDLNLDVIATYWEPDGDFPDREPNPLLEENRRFIVETGPRGEAGPGDRLGRRRRSLLLHRRGGRVLRRRLRLRAAGARGAAQGPGGDDPLRPPLQQGRSRHGRRGRRPLGAEPRRSRVLQGADARGGGRLRRRGLGPLLLPRLLLRGLGHDPRPADPRADLPGGPLALRADGRVPLQVLHLRRDQLGGRGPAGQDARDRGAVLGRRDHEARRRLGRLRRLALQRPALEHRAAAAPESRVPGLPRAHGGEAGRGARFDRS